MKLDHVALLIDADNVSMDVIEQAIVWTAKHCGGPHLRRAYCTPESAVKHQERFKRLSIRPIVNLAAGKNSTDIALAVDAIEIAVTERPDVFVIASSDSDFAPVVARLRERGCRVVGLGQHGKVGQETQGIYDDYEIFEHNGDESAGASAPRKTAARKSAARKAPAAKKTAAKKTKAASEGPAPAARKTAARKTTARKTTAKKSAAGTTADAGDVGTAPPAAFQPASSLPPAPERAPRPSPAQAHAEPQERGERGRAAGPGHGASARGADAPGGVKIEALMRALPELEGGAWMQLNLAGQRLREARLLGKSGSSIRLLKQFPDRFILDPADRPNRVRAA